MNNAISNITITADKIKLEGYTTINEGFSIDEYGSMTATSGFIAGLKITGNALTNEGFDNDSYIILRNDPVSTFVGIGCDVSASPGYRITGRFENRRNDGDLLYSNIAIRAVAENGVKNYALLGTGNIVTSGAIADRHLWYARSPKNDTVTIVNEGAMESTTLMFYCSHSNSGISLPTLEAILNFFDVSDENMGDFLVKFTIIASPFS